MHASTLTFGVVGPPLTRALNGALRLRGPSLIAASRRPHRNGARKAQLMGKLCKLLRDLILVTNRRGVIPL